MHREIMESRIPSNYFYIPFVYLCFIYVEQRTRICVPRYCNNRMYILVKEYRIIFWVMELFYHASSKIDGLFYDDGDKKCIFQCVCPLKSKIITIRLTGISFYVYSRNEYFELVVGKSSLHCNLTKRNTM